MPLEISLVKRYFPVTIGSRTVQLKPCNIKLLKKFAGIKPKDIEIVPELLKDVLDNNTKGYKFKQEIIDIIEDTDKITILNEYFDWVNSKK